MNGTLSPPGIHSKRLLFVFGTRPEAIKLAIPVREAARQGFDCRVAVTAQHRELLDQVLRAFEIVPHHDLNCMSPGQSLSEITARMLAELEPVIAEERPDLLVVQGDTATTFCGALAAFHQRVPVAHVEAGLRTGDPLEPFPEEMNRILTGRLASLHLAPTARAAQNLLDENVPRHRIAVTGNTGIDALFHVRDRLPPLDSSAPARKSIVVTAHRRESFGSGMAGVCEAVQRLAARDDVTVSLPLHPNPNVQAAFRERLASVPRVELLPPLEYVPFVDLLRRAYILITDSGGVQEEGPSLGKPILVLRDKTERPEAVEAGTVRLVGCDPDRIVAEANLLLDSPEEYAARARIHNPYGDGQASSRICIAIARFLEKGIA